MKIKDYFGNFAINTNHNNIKMKKLFISAAISLFCTSFIFANEGNPKREFRGAWLHTVHQGQYAKMTTEETQTYLCEQLDLLQEAGCNAVVFQVRPSADAFYPSELEPWSRFLTGTAGKAPYPVWDPLQFMIDACHDRGMELHAWLNPYRVTTSKGEKLPANHIYHKHPERFVTYDNKLYFDPGIPENREFIISVVKDIITRYDVDAVHMDDYFYPYPIPGQEFPDSKSFKQYGGTMKRDDWRRKNVDMLIEGLHKMIVAEKPWVRLGISPFGIWRNKENDPRGSETRGLQNYDALYADVLLWTEKGWVDYMLPQLYWELEKKVASSEILAHWWNDNANGRHMYIGQDVKITMDKPDVAPSTDVNQLDHKIRLSRELPDIQGNCWWPGYMITSNYKGIAEALAEKLQSTVAIVPSYPWIDNIAPDEVAALRQNGDELVWKAPATDDVMQMARAYVVYRFEAEETPNINNAEAIAGITYEPSFELADNDRGCTFIITVLDRANNESAKGVAIIIK